MPETPAPQVPDAAGEQPLPGDNLAGDQPLPGSQEDKQQKPEDKGNSEKSDKRSAASLGLTYTSSPETVRLAFSGDLWQLFAAKGGDKGGNDNQGGGNDNGNSGNNDNNGGGNNNSETITVAGTSQRQ